MPARSSELPSVVFGRENVAAVDIGVRWRPRGIVCKVLAPFMELRSFGGEGDVLAGLAIRQLLENIVTMASCCIAPELTSKTEVFFDFSTWLTSHLPALFKRHFMNALCSTVSVN